MRIAFHYHIPATERDGRIWMPGYLARFVDSLAQHAGHLYCLQHTPLPSERSKCDTALGSLNVDLVPLGPHRSIPARVLRAGQYTEELKRIRPSLDAILIRGPTPLLPLLGNAAVSLGVPLALLLVGDYLKGISGLSQPRWKKVLARVWALGNRLGQDRLARRSLVVVNSRELYQEYQGRAARLVETRTTTLLEDDLFWREDACTRRPIELLFAGRFAKSKGLLDILDAVRILRGRGYGIRLNLVGWEEQGSRFMEKFERLVAEYGMKAEVRNHGFKRVGDELLGIYRQSDIYVIASRVAEGFPRTIWEAMASSTPVVATSVGSIPHFLEDGRHAVLVEPQRPNALATGIGKVITDEELRRRIVEEGFALARENTVQRRAREMIQVIEDWRSTTRRTMR